MTNVFADNAPMYWEAGLPVIPLKTMGKMPAIGRWQLYSDMMPHKDEQEVWLRSFANGNIGLPLGPAAGLVAIDLDNEDPKVMDAIASVIPISPWVRIGAKGAVMVYKWRNERNFNILMKDTRKTLVECRGKGTQIAIPPSIHPDTQLPYTSNVPLIDVMHIVPELPDQLERRLRDAFNSAGIDVGNSGNTKVSVFVPSGARDNAMVSMAGVLSRGIIRGERTLNESLGEIKAWVENFTEKVAGDDVNVEKAQAKLVEFLIRDVTGEKNAQLPPGWDEGLTSDDKQKLGLSFTEDQEIWNFERIRDFLADTFKTHTEIGSPGWMAAVEVALSKIARNDKMSELDQDRLIKFINDQSGKTLGISSLKRRIHSLKKNERSGEDHSEIAGYVITDFQKFGNLKYWAGRFWQWKGAAWEEVQEVEFKRHIAEEYGFFPAAKRASDHHGIVKVMASLVYGPLKEVEIHGLNYANGFLTENLDLLPHNPDFGCQYVLPYRYLPEKAGHFPIFMQYLTDSWGQDPDFSDKVDALQEVMAATMFGIGYKYERCVLLYGEGKTGKTRLMEIMKGLLPEGVVSAVPPHDWSDKFLPAQMHGKLMNIAGELSESRMIEGNNFKEIISGNPITGQFKNQQPFVFDPHCTHWFSSNHIPKTRDTSDGFTRRWLFFKFNYPVPEEKKIIELDRVILAAEREEIAAWAAQGVKRLKENGQYTLPTSHMVLSDQVANYANSVRYFLLNCGELVLSKEKEVSETALYHTYYSFCISTQVAKPVMQKKFQELMRTLENAFKIQFFMGKINGKDVGMYRGIGVQKV